MHILFVDESGSPPERDKAAQQPFFVLGGIVIPEDIWAKMAGDLARLKAQFQVAGEIKWRHFAPDKGGKPHPLSHLPGEAREVLRTQLYQVIAKYKSVRLICVVTQTERAYEQAYITSDDDVYWYSYKQLTERFQYYPKTWSGRWVRSSTASSSATTAARRTMRACGNCTTSC